MTKLPIQHQTSQENIPDTLNDDSKDWLTRIIESAEEQYRTLGDDGLNVHRC